MSGLFKRLFSRTPGKKASSSTASESEAIILKRDQHCVSRKKVSKNALKVLYKLNENGFQAYLVGGGVRDILLGLQPKDFDVATDATPEQVKSIFKNSRLIGRRFRLAHILYGREIIEVATFRANHNEPQKTKESANKNDQSRTSDHGMLMRDNVYGNMVDDAFRRDFTLNALYYTVRDFSVIDYTNGLDDLAERKLRLIGEPEERYREDPVRILRAIRLACKLNLTIGSETAKPIPQLSELLTHVSPARLWDESNKMLLSGSAETTWNALRQRNVARYLFSQTIISLELKPDSYETQQFEQFIKMALQSTDKRIHSQLPVTPAFLYAVFLWAPLQHKAQQLIGKGLPFYEANQKAASQVMEKQRQSIGIPKRFSMVAKEIWSLQNRLSNLRKKNVYSVFQHQRFRAAYDFLCLRAGDDDELQKLSKWWTDFQQADDLEQNKMINSVSHPPKKKRRYKSKKKRSGPPPN